MLGILLAIINIAKLKKKLLNPQYWDQIKYSLKISLKELEYKVSDEFIPKKLRVSKISAATGDKE